MFGSARKKLVTWTPEPDGGETFDPISLRLRPLAWEWRLTIAERMAGVGKPNGDKAAAIRACRPALAGCIVGWEGVCDEAGNPLPCTPENALALLEQRYDATMEVMQALMGTGGEPAGKKKDSPAGSDSASPTPASTATKGSTQAPDRVGGVPI